MLVPDGITPPEVVAVILGLVRADVAGGEVRAALPELDRIRLRPRREPDRAERDGYY